LLKKGVFMDVHTAFCKYPVGVIIRSGYDSGITSIKMLKAGEVHEKRRRRSNGVGGEFFLSR
jgi:hypothetical protein